MAGMCTRRDRGETETLKPETEAKTKTFSLEAEARPERLKFQPRRDRADALLRLETASRPRRQDRGHAAAKSTPLNSCHNLIRYLLIFETVSLAQSLKIAKKDR